MPQKVPRFHRGTQDLIDLLLAILVVAITLTTRLPALDAFSTPDEYRGMRRSVPFCRVLYTGDLAQARQTGHPGVLTMWLVRGFIVAYVPLMTTSQKKLDRLLLDAQVMVP